MRINRLICLFGCMILLLQGNAFAEESCCYCEMPTSSCYPETLLEASVGYFYPTGSKFRKIYGGNAIYRIEFSVETFCSIYPWISVGYFGDSGHSIGKRNRTTIDMVPLAGGLKYFSCNECFRPYLGIGVAGTYVHTDDHSPFVIRHHSDWGIGGIVKGGILYSLSQCFYLDAFVDFTYMKVDDHRSKKKVVSQHRADVSGVSVGLGIGYSF